MANCSSTKIARKHSQNSHKDRPKFVRRQFKTKRLVSKNFKDSINGHKSSEVMWIAKQDNRQNL